MTIRRTRRVRGASGRGPRKPPDERKDYLIQARVPRELDDVLKRDAKRKRLSVSHLIRNVLEDTYKLVDGVISDVDTIVQESVELTGRMRRDARELARSAARVHEAHVHERDAAAAKTRDAQSSAGSARIDHEDHEDHDARRSAQSALPRSERARDAGAQPRPSLEPAAPPTRSERASDASSPSDAFRGGAPVVEAKPGSVGVGRGEAGSPALAPAPDAQPMAAPGRVEITEEAQRAFEEHTADIYAWNPVVLNRPARCERCSATLQRGDTGNLGLSQDPKGAPRWLCGGCLATL